MMNKKTKKGWGGQGHGRGGYYPKKTLKTNVPWRQQSRGFPYEGNLDDLLTDKKYLEDRKKLFRENGYGWWWIPTKGERR